MGRIEIIHRKPGPEANSGTNVPARRGADWRRILPGLTVSLVSLVAVFYFADLSELIEALRLADYRLVLAAIALMLVWLVVRGFFWRTLLQEQASFRQVFLTLNEGYLLNNLLPFRLGEVGRGFLLSRKAGIPFWQVLSTILVERVLDLTLAVGVLLSTLPFVVGASWQGSAAAGAGVAVLLVFCTLYLLARYRERVMGVFEKLGARWPVVLKLGGRALPAFTSGLAAITEGTRFLRAIGWVVLNWAVAILQYYVLLLAFFPQGRLLWSTFTLGVSALGIAAPSSPGAVGVYEAAMVGSLSLFGLDPSGALALAITGHLLQYLITGLLGAYALVQDGESLTGLYRRVRQIQPQAEG